MTTKVLTKHMTHSTMVKSRMDKIVKSLNAQQRVGTLERNLNIVSRFLNGESPSRIAQDYHIPRQQVYKLAERYKLQQQELVKWMSK